MSNKRDLVLGFYETADHQRQKSAPIDAGRIAALMPLLTTGREPALLDIGCYDGAKTAILAKYVGAKRVCGVDFLVEQLDLARGRGIETARIDLNQGEGLPFADRSFDLIFVGDVIEHIFSPDLLLEEIARLLKPGGYALLTTPNLASWRNRIALLLGWQPFMTEVSTRYRVGNPRAPTGLPSGHIRVFAPRALRELPTYYGLAVVHLGGMRLPGRPAGLIGRLSHLIDKLLLRVAPTLCDELVIKLERR